jgi:prepilin peptidase CpaA
MTTEHVTWLVWAILALAALEDMWRLRIANLFPVLLVILFPVWVWIVGVAPGLWENVALFGLTLAVGLFMFARKWLGGGDVKLLAAIALWFNFQGGLTLLISVTIGGGLLALGFIFVRRFIPARVYDQTGWAALKPKGPIPYGLAIAVGAILCSQLQGFSPTKPSNMLSVDLKAMATAANREIVRQPAR